MPAKRFPFVFPSSILREAAAHPAGSFPSVPGTGRGTGQPGSWKRELFSQLSAGGSRCDAGLQSELIIACRNCAAARRVHIIQLARGPAASLARAHVSSHSLARTPSPPRVKIIRGGPPLALPSLRCLPRYARCPVPDVTDPLVPCLRRDPGPLSDRLAAPALPFSPISTRCRSENRPSPTENLEQRKFFAPKYAARGWTASGTKNLRWFQGENPRLLNGGCRNLGVRLFFCLSRLS